MTKNKNKPAEANPSYVVTPEGSLGLLALGATGLKKWREVRDAEKKKNPGRKK